MDIHFTDGDFVYFFWDDILPGFLNFIRVIRGWNVRILNLPTINPRIEGVLYRDGNYLMVSTGL